MKKHMFLLQSSAIVVAAIIMISLSSMIAGAGSYLFYNLLYGFLLSTVLPLWLTKKGKGSLESLGIKKLGLK